MTDVATLSMKVDATDISVASRELDKLSASGARAEQSTTTLSSSFATLSGVVRTVGVSFAAYKLIDYARDATLLSARYETLGISMYQAGKNSGYMRVEMDAFQAGLEKTGISMVEARNTLIQMSAANMDLANATKLARAAQDLAVVGNTNSSDAFNRLVYGIKSGHTETLRTLGINVSFEESYKRLREELKRGNGELTENEKLQARTNATMEATIKYQGIYEQAMGTAGKQLTSLTRYQENFKVIVGETFNESLAAAVGAYTTHLKDATTEAQALKDKGDLKQWGRDAALALAHVADIARLAGNTFMFMGSSLLLPIYGLGALTDIAAKFATGGMKGASEAAQKWSVSLSTLAKAQDDAAKGGMDTWMITDSVNNMFVKSDEFRNKQAAKLAQEYIDIPKKAAAAYLAASKQGVKAQEAAYMDVMNSASAGYEWKGRGKVDDKPPTTLSGGKGIAAKQLTYDIDSIKKSSAEMLDTYSNAEKVMEAVHASGKLSDTEYYSAKLAFINLTGKTKEAELLSEIARYEREASSGKLNAEQKIANSKSIMDTMSALKKVRADSVAEVEIAGIQEENALIKVRDAYAAVKKSAEDYLATVARKNARELSGIGMGTEYRTKQEGINAIEDRQIAAMQALESRKATLKSAMTQEMYDNEKATIQKTYETEIAMYENKTAKIKAAESSWLTGASDAMNNYATEVNNVAKQTEHAFTNAFKSMEDALVQFVRTGKLDFKSLADSIVSDIIRIQVQQNITGPLAKAMGGGSEGGFLGDIFGNIFRGGSQGAAALNQSGPILSSMIPGYADGTDYVPYDMVAKVHKGEKIVPAAENNGSKTVTVINNFTIPQPTDRRTQEQIAAMAGASIQHAMMRNA